MDQPEPSDSTHDVAMDDDAVDDDGDAGAMMVARQKSTNGEGHADDAHPREQQEQQLAAQEQPHDMDALNISIDKEIVYRMQHRSWKQMDLCFKWRLIKEYIESLGVEQKVSIADVRGMLKHNQLLDVEYDGTRVTKLNALDV